MKAGRQPPNDIVRKPSANSAGNDGRYCSAREAATALGISAATLYAYVSRGLVRSEEGTGSSRARRYHREDVARLKERRAQRRNPALAAAQALDMGAPVLDSSLTLIAGGRVYYRGRDALELARTHSLEAVAGLLWLNNLDTDIFGGITPPAVPKSAKSAGTYVERFQMALAAAAPRDPLAWDLRPAAVAQTGARILTLLVGVAADGANANAYANANAGAGTIGERLARAWAPRARGAAQRHIAAILNSALIICADHELNVSAFTARCVASAGATPWHVVIAGMAALQGSKHGGDAEQAEALLAEVDEPVNSRDVLLRHIKVGKTPPGFGHRLYPQGDPRAKLLLELAGSARSHAARPDKLALSSQVLRTAQSLSVDEPNIDFGLATLRHALDLPEGASLAIFALGRTVGWIAHAIEQYQLDRLIRPRARYVGLQPSAVPS